MNEDRLYTIERLNGQTFLRAIIVTDKACYARAYTYCNAEKIQLVETSRIRNGHIVYREVAA